MIYPSGQLYPNSSLNPSSSLGIDTAGSGISSGEAVGTPTVERYIVASAAGGNWNATTAWVGGVVPTAADNVKLASTSGNITINAAAACRSLDCSGYTGTLTHNAATTLSIGDATAGAFGIALKFVTGMTYTLGSTTTSAVAFVSSSTTQQTVDWAGKTTGNVQFGSLGVQGSWKVVGTTSATWNANGSVSTQITHGSGTLDVSGLTTINSGLWVSSGTSTRTITFGGVTINLNSAGNAFNNSTSTGLTITANTATVNLTASGPSFFLGGKDWNGLSINHTGGGILTYGTSAILGTATVANLSRTSNAVKTEALTLSADLIVTGTFTYNGNSVLNRGLVQSNTRGTQRTLTAAAVSISNLDIQDVAATGAAAPFTGTSLGDALGNSGITFDSPLTLYRTGAGGNWSSSQWSLTSGGASGQRVPLPQDNVNIDSTASGTITLDMPRIGANIDLGGPDAGRFAGTLAHSSTAVAVYGTWRLSSSGAYTGGNNVSLQGRGSHTLQTYTTLAQPYAIDSRGGTYTMVRDFASNQSFTHTAGTLTTNNFAITCASFNSATGNVRTLNYGTSVITMTGTGTVYNATTSNGTFNTDSAILVTSNTSATLRTFTITGAQTWGEIRHTSSSTATLALGQGSTLTLDTLNVTAGKTVQFTAGRTTNVTNWNVNGAAGSLTTIQSSTAGTTATVSKASGTVSADYLNIKDITATGGATWNAGGNSVDLGNNSGWIFGGGLQSLSPAGITTLESVGVHQIQPGSVFISATGIGTLEALGALQIQPGVVLVSPGGISSLEAFGITTVTPPAVIVSVQGITTAENLGTATIQPTYVIIDVGNIPSQAATGTPAIELPPYLLQTLGITSEETFGNLAAFEAFQVYFKDRAVWVVGVSDKPKQRVALRDSLLP